MTVEKKIDGTKMYLTLEGRLDTGTAPILEDILKEELSDKDFLGMDFEKLDYISSAGLRLLLFAQKTMNLRGKMEISNVNSSVMEVLDITGFSDILTIV